MSYNLPQRALVSQADSAMIPRQNVPRSVFRNRWTRITAFDPGVLVPILVQECLPGDHMTYNVTPYIRISTLLFPMFSEMRIDTHFFFVPNRLVWEHFINQQGERPDPLSSTAYTTPQQQSTIGGDPVNSLPDHFGIPTVGQINPGTQFTYNALPFRAYALIWNTWFRDENIQNSIAIPTGDGPDPAGGATHINLLRRAKSHDYFTSCLPWPQAPGVTATTPTVPLSGLAPVTGIGFATQAWTAGPSPTIYQTTGPVVYPFYKGPIDATGANNQMYAGQGGATGDPLIYATLDGIGGFTINSLRQAWAITQLLERDARGGTRYIENVREHFGVTVPDYRLQRPEYIGGGQTPLNITPVAQTAPTTGLPVGALGAAGTAAGTHRASYACQEHGFIIGLISVKSEIAYQQGLHRMWTRLTRNNYFIPALADLGEQAVLFKEIYCTGIMGGGDGDGVFGYQERWHEYRTQQNEVVGKMRSTALGTIDAWHLAQKFGPTYPLLNPNFIVDNPPIVRAVAAGSLADQQYFIGEILYERTAVRPIPTFSIPATIGRF